MRRLAVKVPVATFILIALGGGILVLRQSQKGVVQGRPARETALVAVVQHILKDTNTQPNDIVFLRIDDRDPANTVLQRVRRMHPNTSPASACRTSPPSGKVVDIATGQPGRL